MASSSPSFFVQLCGQVAPLASLVVFLSPVPTMQKIKRDGSVGTFPLLPYSSMVCSAFLWTTYGVLKQEPAVWGSNFMGLLLGLYYTKVFIHFAPARAPTLPGSVQQHVQVMVGTVVSTFVLLLVGGTEWATWIVGKVAVVLCLAMFASPLAAVKTVLQTQSARSIPLPFTMASLVNCFAWTVYGLLGMHDPNIYLTNTLGLSFCVAQVALKVKYGDHRAPFHDDDLGGGGGLEGTLLPK